jgi:2,3-bisphosphoglycerate-independent phosphoglycerate mutase
MDVSETWEHLIQDGGVIVYVIIDGLGGLPDPKKGGTELQIAHTPNLDRIARGSSCGLLELVGPGITPGSGPGHLALFGYDPLRYTPGRGIFSALGIDFALKEGDVAARVSFATVNREGRVVDRRAGRIDTDTNRRLCKKIREAVKLDYGGLFYLETVSEHRAVVVLQGKNLGSRVRDTEPSRTGEHPLEPVALDEDSKRTASIVQSFVDQAKDILSDQERANMVLLRGFDTYTPLPSLKSRFGLRGVCVAEYPMYRGIGRLLGMRIEPPPEGIEASFQALRALYGHEYDFYYLHIKETDSSGEDGDFEQKVKAIERVDRLMPMVMDLNPDVLVVTADHSTPVCMRSHSWHPVPLMIYSMVARVDEVNTFDEYACMRGSLGIRPGLHLMGLALAHAGRLVKYGA